jgi:hypothetical protein
MKLKSRSELQKELTETKEQLTNLTEQLDKIQTQDKTIYRQVNSLLLWKGALKVKINESCPNKDLVGKEGYLCDLFVDGWTVVVYGDPNNPANWTSNDFYRLDANYLDVVSWDTQKFVESMKVMGYVQHQGQWLHISKLAELQKS